MHEYAPPSHPPPLLNANDIWSLGRQGWLLYDLPKELLRQIQHLNETAKLFFAKSSQDKLASLGGKNHEEEGWFDVPKEKEYVTFRRTLTGHSELEQQASLVWTQVTTFLHQVLCDLSRAGGLPLYAWDDMVADQLTFPPVSANLRDVSSLMRLFRYLPTEGTAAQHTDLGLLTLCVGTGAGLEVLDRWQQPPTWHDGSKCTILVGETLRRLSQDNMNAGIHRVVGNPAGRQSFVFALRPNLAAVIDASNFGGQGSIALRDLFTDIKGSKYNVNARPEVREQQKERQRDRKVTAQEDKFSG